MSQLDRRLIEQLKKQVQEELAKKEAECVEYWLAELQKIYNRRHQTLSELKSELRHFMERMKNRIQVIRTRGF